MVDSQSELYDRRLANHLVSLYYRETDGDGTFVILNLIRFEFSTQLDRASVIVKNLIVSELVFLGLFEERLEFDGFILLNGL